MWKITDALNHTWEYTYTSYGDVKSVQDPENAVTSYVYDYELNEAAYGKVRKVIDPMGRETVYEYYGASDGNLARRGQLKKVIVPGGFWREMDYGGAGWLVRREVQTASGSEVTTYTYDAWGRLRRIDYPRSADVVMGYDGENRRVWVQDGIGRREYTYDAWGRVIRQQGCCGETNETTTYYYDAAGRSEGFTDPTGRRVIYHYNPLGQLDYAKDNRGQITLAYDAAGRVKQYQDPDGAVKVYHYNAITGELERQQWWNSQGELEHDFMLKYDLRHRLQRSEDVVRGEVLEITYDDMNRTVLEQRTGELAYTKVRIYNADGSLHSESYSTEEVQSWFIYVYDEAGRLSQIVDLLRGSVYSFQWNGAWLTRWDASDRSYARLFRYDEEGRITRVDRQDLQTGEVRSSLEYRYSWGGGRWYKRDYMRGIELRETCGGAVSWYREEGSTDWQIGMLSYFGQADGCCGVRGGNRAVMEDAWWMPEEFETQVPALCIAAYGCGAICLTYLLFPCLGRVRGSSDPWQCLLECLAERFRGLHPGIQVLCLGCGIGCLVCVLSTVPLPRIPVPPNLGNLLRGLLLQPVPALGYASAAFVGVSPCDPPAAPPPPPAPPAPSDPPTPSPQPRPTPPPTNQQPEPQPPWHPQPRPYDPPRGFPIDPIIPPILRWTPEDDDWCTGVCDFHCRWRMGLEEWEWAQCFSGCTRMCTGYGWLPKPNDPYF